MTELDLEAIKARCKTATPPPWTTFFDGTNLGIHSGERAFVYCIPDDDRKFIVYARTDVPALVAEVERLRAALAKALGETNEPDDFVELFGRFLINEITT